MVLKAFDLINTSLISDKVLGTEMLYFFNNMGAGGGGGGGYHKYNNNEQI